jgi:hypothetical protein
MRPIISSDMPFDLAKEGKKGAMMDRARLQITLQIINKMKT